MSKQTKLEALKLAVSSGKGVALAREFEAYLNDEEHVKVQTESVSTRDRLLNKKARG